MFVDEAGGGGATTIDTYYKIRLKKWNGSSETNISDEVQTTTVTTSTGDMEAAFVVELDCAKTLIKKGEQLRLTIVPYGRNADNSTSFVISLGINPADTATTNFTAGNSRLQVSVPFNMVI